VSSDAGTNLKVGGHTSGEKRRKIFWRAPPLLWLYKYNQSLWWALSWWSVQFVQFLVCFSSTHGAPRAQPFVKVGARAPAPYGVGATVLEHFRHKQEPSTSLLFPPPGGGYPW